jgi:undecaprenyl-diphosphatase
MDPLQGVDNGTYYFFRYQRKAAGPILQFLMDFGNELGSDYVLAALALVLLGLLVVRRRYRQAAAFVVAAAIAVLLLEGLRQLVGRPRPLEALESSPSFPSGTALLSSALFIFLAIHVGALISRRSLRFLLYAGCLILVMLIGTSTLYLGKNYLTDLLAGWTAGALLALVCLSPAAGQGRLTA